MNRWMEKWLREKLKEYHGQKTEGIGVPRKVCHRCKKPRELPGSRVIERKFYCEKCAHHITQPVVLPPVPKPQPSTPDYFSDPNVLREFLSTGAVPRSSTKGVPETAESR